MQRMGNRLTAMLITNTHWVTTENKQMNSWASSLAFGEAKLCTD